MNGSNALTGFLAKVNCFDLITCQVNIGKESFEACRYKQNVVAPERCQNPGPYTREMIYCLGKLPTKQKKVNVCYTVEGDDREWYIAGYTMQNVEPLSEYNPLGHNFLLAPWEVPDGTKIDSYEKSNYLRVPMVIVEN